MGAPSDVSSMNNSMLLLLTEICVNISGIEVPADIVHWFGCTLPRWHALVLLMFHLLIISINLPTLVIFMISRELNTKTSSVFFACLSLSDLISTLAYLGLLSYYFFIPLDRITPILAAVYEGIRVGMIQINFFNFSLASLYRMIALRFPIWYQCKLNRKRTLIAELCIWIGSLIFTISNFLPGFIFGISYDPGTLSVTLVPKSSKALIPLGIVSSVPLITILVFNGVIFWTQLTKKKIAAAPAINGQDGNVSRPINNSFSKPYRTLVLILIFFYISWVPVIISMVLQMTESTNIKISSKVLVHYILGLLNKSYSIGNNFILYNTQTVFKREFRRYLVDPWMRRCCASGAIEPRNGSDNQPSDLPTFWVPSGNKTKSEINRTIRNAFVST